MTPIRLLTCLAVLYLATTPPNQVRGQETPKPAVVDNALETLRNRVTQSELSDDEKARILEVVTQAETQAKEAAAKAEAHNKNQAAIKFVPTLAESAKKQLESLRDFKPTASPNQVFAELESRLSSLNEQVAKAEAEQKQAEASVGAASQRRTEIESELPKLEKQLLERRSQIETAKADPVATLQGEAALAELLASESLLAATIDAMKSEAALIDAEAAAGLRQLLRDTQTRRLETLQLQQQLVKKEVEAARTKAAVNRVETAGTELKDLHLALRPIGEQNQKLAEDDLKVSSLIKDVQSQLGRRQARLEELEHAFTQAKTRVSTVGLSDAIGAMLRNLKQSLPSISAYRLRLRERQPVINEAQYDLIELTDRRNMKLDFSVATLFRSADPPISAEVRSSLDQAAKDLFEAQRTDYLDPAIRSQTTYFNTLVSLSTTEQQIIQLIEEATHYTNERILWIRSSKPIYSQLIPSTNEWWFLLAAAWSNLPEKVTQELSGQYLLWIAAFSILIVLFRLGTRLRRHIHALGEQATKSSYTQFGSTMQSFALTLATAAPLPLVFGFVGWRLGISAGSDQATLALARAATTVAVIFFPINLLRQVCRHRGLAISHFGWPEDLVNDLRRSLRWLLATTLPFAFVISFLNAGTTAFGYDTLERYCYIGVMAILCVFTAKIAHLRRGLPAHYLKLVPNGWTNRLAYIWYPIAVAFPVVLAWLAALGYYFTSQQLGWRFFQSLCLLTAIVLVMSLVVRWILLHRRKLRIAQARIRRQETSEAATAEPLIPLASVDAAKDLQLQMQQTRRLLHTISVVALLVGIWFIWNDVRPAVDFFEKWPIWHSTTKITETIPSDTGLPTTRTREVLEAITIANVTFAFVILLLTGVATRNIPGLLEFAILSRLPLDRSARYAITALVSYAIILVGILIAGRELGLHWNQIQWMATALTFGLAFGLQEMFANFIAGIIILFERPVRVGDVVEIDNVTGVVTQIRIRATTITNWDKKDFIVPNKEFITGKLLNWTRSDQVSRLVITVGVAYGSDTQETRKILERIVREHPDVLEEPQPMIVFDQFADSSLNFTIRAFVGAMDKRLPVTHALHTAIDEAFRQANIEIAFPQHDLHLRTIPDQLRAGLT